MEARKNSSSATTSCKKHTKHRQSPGICSLCLRERLSKISSTSSLCLRERLSKISSTSSRAVTNVSSSSSSYSISSVSSVYSSHNSSNASSYTASPMQNYRNRRKINNLEGKGKGKGKGKGYIYFLKKNTKDVLKKSRSMAFVSDQKNVMQEQEIKEKVGFWSKLMGSKRSSSRMMHSRTMRETFFSRV